MARRLGRISVWEMVSAIGIAFREAKDLIYKGSKVQRCPSITGSNPNWGEQEQLKGSSGWVFKSPLLEKVWAVPKA